MGMNCTICKRPVYDAGGSIAATAHVECQNAEILEGLRDILFPLSTDKTCTKCHKPSDWFMVIIWEGKLEFHCRKCSVDQVVFNSGYGDGENKPGSDVPF